jgi:hypothetical protein
VEVQVQPAQKLKQQTPVRVVKVVPALLEVQATLEKPVQPNHLHQVIVLEARVVQVQVVPAVFAVNN